jgi:ABC-type dipeptide/oligopeptide/nickel transport system permease subunit
MLEVLRTDYVKFARARGLQDRAVYFGHALKNTLVPVITITGLQLGSLIAFAIITETVFQWPGMGFLFIQAVQFADIPVMAAYLCLIALIFVAVNLIVDLLYFAVDPRLRIEKSRRPLRHAHELIPHRPRRTRRAWPAAGRRRLVQLQALAGGHPGRGDRRVCTFCAVFAPWVSPAQPLRPGHAQPVRRAAAAGLAGRRQATYLLGTDDQGRDILSALLYGARISLFVGLASVLLSMVVGVGLGLLSGFAAARWTPSSCACAT